jgi:hypothetical protein
MMGNQNIKASHAAGGELTYEWIGENSYRFTLKFYRDCTGGPAALDSFGMCYENTCNLNKYKTFLKQVLVLPNGDPNGTPVKFGCANNSQCTNSQSTFPGFEEWMYTGDIDLPNACSEWNFWVVEVARNNQDNISSSSSFNLLILASLNSLTAPINSSPIFFFKPVPYVGVNTPWLYNHGSFDADGDSLSYRSITPYTSMQSTSSSWANDCISFNFMDTVVGSSSFPTYNAGTNPFACTANGAFNIDPSTGVFTATPSALGQNVLTVEVSEWRGGIMIGKIIRDIQIAVISNVSWILLSATTNPFTSTISASASGGIPPYLFSLNGGVGQVILVCFNNSEFEI